MDVDEILKSPIFGFVTTILSIIIGIIVSHLYYRKGKQEGDKAAKEYRTQLEEAKLKILGLSKKLEESNRNLNSLIELANKQNIDTYDIMDVLKERSFNTINSDQEIVSHFLTFYEEGKIKAAENFLAAKINEIKNELCRTYMEAYLKIHYKKY